MMFPHEAVWLMWIRWGVDVMDEGEFVVDSIVGHRLEGPN